MSTERKGKEREKEDPEERIIYRRRLKDRCSEHEQIYLDSNDTVKKEKLHGIKIFDRENLLEISLQ